MKISIASTLFTASLLAASLASAQSARSQRTPGRFTVQPTPRLEPPRCTSQKMAKRPYA